MERNKRLLSYSLISILLMNIGVISNKYVNTNYYFSDRFYFNHYWFSVGDLYIFSAVAIDILLLIYISYIFINRIYYKS